MAGPVALTTQVAGTATSAWANSVKALTDNMMAPAHGAFYQSAVTTSIASSTTVWTPVTFDAELSDTVNGHSTSTNTSRYTCQTGWDGLYVVQGSVLFAGNATGQRYVGVAVNGTTPQNGSPDGCTLVPNGSGFAVATYAEVTLAAGDYVQLVALQSSGGALSTVIVGAITSRMSVRWVAKS